LEVEKDKTKAESESFNDGICYWLGNRILVRDLETMEPEPETEDNNSKTESERSGNKVCWWVGNLSQDSKASTSKPGSDSDKLETDSEYSRYKEYCRVKYKALFNSCFCSQKWLLIEMAVEYRVWKVEGLPLSQVKIIS